jgi:hypothetical protein
MLEIGNDILVIRMNLVFDMAFELNQWISILRRSTSGTDIRVDEPFTYTFAMKSVTTVQPVTRQIAFSTRGFVANSTGLFGMTPTVAIKQTFILTLNTVL